MDQIKIATERLKKIFPVDNDQIKFIDDRGDGHHYTLQVISDAFKKRPQIERQRMIYDELEDLIQKNYIHALRMDLKTHEENQSSDKDNSDTNTTSAEQNSQTPTTSSSTSPTKNTAHPLQSLITKSPVMLFMKGDRFLPQCGFSAQIIELLDEYDHIAKYETFDILEDEDVRQDLKEYSNWPTYPQIYVQGELIGGLDIAQDLHEKGELEKILDKAKEN